MQRYDLVNQLCLPVMHANVQNVRRGCFWWIKIVSKYCIFMAEKKR